MTAIVLTGIAALLAGFVIIVALQPSNFRITRSATISAPVAEVFPHVNDLHAFQTWSPWAKLDPDARVTFDGPRAGPGASFTWAGNKNVGEGRMTTLESRANELIRFKLEFLKPFQATNTAEFTFEPLGNQTRVTWSMFGRSSFMCKAVGLFTNCDQMVGGQFEQGFANLQAAIAGEKANAPT